MQFKQIIINVFRKRICFFLSVSTKKDIKVIIKEQAPALRRYRFVNLIGYE